MARVLRSVNNALAVLESFSVERPEIGVTELSHALGLGKSTVHRLLTSLAARGYVRKNPDTERYCLGFKAFEVGSLAAGRGAIREVAAPFLRSLMLGKRPAPVDVLPHRTPSTASLYGAGEGAGRLGARGLARPRP